MGDAEAERVSMPIVSILCNNGYSIDMRIRLA